MTHVLIVDGSLSDRQRMGVTLEAAGHRVTAVATGADGLALLDREPPGRFQLLITAGELEDADACDFLRRVRAHPHARGMPAVVVAAGLSPERVVSLVLAGADQVVPRPVPAAVLLRRVTELLSARRALGQGQEGVVSWPVADYLRRETKRAQRTGRPLSILAVRVGGAAALCDMLLRTVAVGLRETDLIYRSGVNELILVLPDTDAMGARAVETRIGRAAAQLAGQPEWQPLGALQLVTGVSTMPADGVEAHLLIETARGRLRPLPVSPEQESGGR